MKRKAMKATARLKYHKLVVYFSFLAEKSILILKCKAISTFVL